MVSGTSYQFSYNWYRIGTGTQHIVEFYLFLFALQRQQHRSQRPRLPPVTTQGPPPTSNRTAPCRPPMSSPSPESASLLCCGDNTHPVSHTRLPVQFWRGVLARGAVPQATLSRPSTAPLEREVELLKIEVAHWQGHCLEAKQHKVVANWLGIASSTTGS